MNRTITVDHHHLHYSDGSHKLKLSVEWSFVAKTADYPIDLEIKAGDLRTWTEPGTNQSNRQGARNCSTKLPSTTRMAPRPTSSVEIGYFCAAGRRISSLSRFTLSRPGIAKLAGFLAIPIAPPVKERRERRAKYILNLPGITEWTAPKIPLEQKYLEMIANRIVKKDFIDVIGLPAR